MPTIKFTLIWLTLAFPLLDWVAISRQSKQLEYVAKLGTMICLIIWLWLVSGFRGSLIWFALGLVFSLAGDIFLMLPNERFKAGLVAFLIAQISYCIGFYTGFPPVNIATFGLMIVIILVVIRLFRQIAKGLVVSGDEKLTLPILIYTLVISLMLFFALMTLVRPEWAAVSALLVSGGALLFFLSDTFLAWNRFVAPLRYGRLIVIVTYHIGQILITVGAASHFLA